MYVARVIFLKNKGNRSRQAQCITDILILYFNCPKTKFNINECNACSIRLIQHMIEIATHCFENRLVVYSGFDSVEEIGGATRLLDW